MKLYAVVDKDGEPRSNAYTCPEWAWLNFFKFETEGCLERDQDKLKKAYLDMWRSAGFEQKELHTYDPATHGVYETASQVVVDREVYEYVRQIVDDLYGGAYCRPSDAVKKFLSAAKEAT
jgi:hypothetical protein